MNHQLIEISSVIFSSIIMLECVAVIVGSVMVLQNILDKCSTGLRMSFLIFPIGAAIDIMDMFYAHAAIRPSDFFIYAGILVSLRWVWNQKNLFTEFEHLMIENHNKSRAFFDLADVKLFMFCIALSAIRAVTADDKVVSNVYETLKQNAEA